MIYISQINGTWQLAQHPQHSRSSGKRIKVGRLLFPLFTLNWRSCGAAADVYYYVLSPFFLVLLFRAFAFYMTPSKKSSAFNSFSAAAPESSLQLRDHYRYDGPPQVCDDGILFQPSAKQLHKGIIDLLMVSILL